MFGSTTGLEGGLFDQLLRIKREMDDAFGTWPADSGIRAVTRGAFPMINIGASADEVNVYVFAAGMDPAAAKISLQQNLLTIEGERKVEADENSAYYMRERFNGTFRRALTLPEDVDPDRVEAHYRDGVLQIKIKRHEAMKPRRITVS